MDMSAGIFHGGDFCQTDSKCLEIYRWQCGFESWLELMSPIIWWIISCNMWMAFIFSSCKYDSHLKCNDQNDTICLSTPVGFQTSDVLLQSSRAIMLNPAKTSLILSSISLRHTQSDSEEPCEEAGVRYKNEPIQGRRVTLRHYSKHYSMLSVLVKINQIQSFWREYSF